MVEIRNGGVNKSRINSFERYFNLRLYLSNLKYVFIGNVHLIVKTKLSSYFK